MKTTINGKEIKLYGQSELSAIYTNVIQNYLNSGYVLTFGEFSRGSQGEEAKADLTNDGGKTIYRVWVDNSYRSKIYPKDRSCYVLSIVVKKYTNVRQYSTLWFSEGEIVSEIKFYSICDNHRGSRKVYVYSEEDFDLVKDFQNKRFDMSHDLRGQYTPLSNISPKTVLNVVRKQKGHKSTLLKDIKSIERHVGHGYYKINLVGNSSVIVRIAK